MKKIITAIFWIAVAIIFAFFTGWAILVTVYEISVFAKFALGY